MRSSLIPLPPLLTLGILTIGAACGPGKTDRSADSVGTGAAMTAVRADSGQMAMPAGGQGMSGMHQDTLVRKVDAHLQRMKTTNADSLRALVSDDRQVVTSLIADCEQMMRQMKMEPPRKWQSAVQDLRTDLDRMASMTGPQLTQAMPEHRKRIEGMLAMRRDMMRM
ncbi:MAG: hypothetical protein H0W68_01165 [Gemmatimonadaceae bacterium]|nr:hypothetical protein [Gemmatimonadaceae bacterium]